MLPDLLASSQVDSGPIQRPGPLDHCPLQSRPAIMEEKPHRAPKLPRPSAECSTAAAAAAVAAEFWHFPL